MANDHAMAGGRQAPHLLNKATFVSVPQSGGDIQPVILSYLGMRKWTGMIGCALPVVLAIGRIVVGGHGIEGSISAYYFTRMGGVFVGSLWVIGFFMMSCRGYDEKDEVAGRLAGIFAIGVALLPMNIYHEEGWPALRGNLHWTCAALLFLTLAYFCLALFTKGSGPPTPMKIKRNRWYRTCGYTILACIALIGINSLACRFMTGLAKQVALYDPVFFLESGAVIAFGTAWLIKGETFLKD